MPCYTVQTLSVEFKAKHTDLLLEAAESLGLNCEIKGHIASIDYGAIKINLETQQAEYKSYHQNTLNNLKVAYSTKAVEKVAQKRKWLLKQTGKNQMKLRRF